MSSPSKLTSVKLQVRPRAEASLLSDLLLHETAHGLQEEDTTIHQACLFHIQNTCVAVLATSKGLQIWDVDTQKQLYSWDLCSKPMCSSPTSSCRGLALLQVGDDGCLLCVGSDAGTIHTFDTSNMRSIQHNNDITHHNAPIAALTSQQTSSTHMLASSDDHGAITVFHAKSGRDFRVVHSWEGHGVPCVSIAIKKSTLIGAFYDGSMRLHSLVKSIWTVGHILCQCFASPCMMAGYSIAECLPSLCTPVSAHVDASLSPHKTYAACVARLPHQPHICQSFQNMANCTMSTLGGWYAES